MLIEERMKINKVFNILVFIFCIITSFFTYADNIDNDFFNNLEPRHHVNKNFSNERINDLNKNELNYDDIEDLIHLYNPDILSNWNSWENNKSAQDIQDEYNDAAMALFDSAASQDSELQEGMLNAQAIAMQIQADKNASDSYTNFLSNYLTEMQLVLSTKILDLNYQKSSFELLNANEALNEAKRSEEKANNSLLYGNGTQIELLNAKKAVVDAKSNLVLATSSQKTYKSKLLLNCGKEISEEIYITPIDFNVDIDINNINLEVDYKTALQNSIQYEIYRRKIENAQTDEVKNEFKILYDAAPKKIYNDLENKYRNIIDTLDSIHNKSISLELAKDNNLKASNEYKNGNISNKDYMTSKYKYNVANNDLVSAKYDLKIAIENYLYALKGYSDC